MFPIFAGNSASTGYNLTRSLRFRASASAYLNRTPASASNRQKFTISVWYKAGRISASEVNANILNAGGDGSSVLISGTGAFGGTYQDRLLYREGGTTLLYWPMVFRDPASWYHIVFAMDTTQATAANRTKLYVNGVDQGAFSGTAITQNASTSINNTSAHYINTYNGTFYPSDLYYTEYNFVDGQQLTPSSFGSTNALTGVWQPARYTGSYGTNGFYLPFTDNSALTTSSNVGLGKDFSGNANYWVTNNISITAGVTYDSMTDVPTLTSATAANFAVLNPLFISTSAGTQNATLTQGNLAFVGNITNDSVGRSTIGVTTGSFYCEITIGNVSAIQDGVGIAYTQSDSTRTAGVIYRTDGTKCINNTVTSYGSSYVANDVIGIALNATSSQVTFYKNNVSQGAISFTPTTAIYFSTYGINSATSFSGNINFGQRPFTYTPPSGFVALNTYNLPTSTIVKGNTVMDVLTWSGTGGSPSATRSLTGLNFKPDFVWEKDRASGQDHHLFDSVRGAGLSKTLASNSTAAEGGFNDTLYGYLSSFDSNGVTTTNGSSTWDNWNKSGDTYVAWAWQAGQGTNTSNTNGTITSTVSVNASAGFSVVTYTGTGTNGATVGHGLGVTPSMMIFKRRNTTSDWATYHASIGNTGVIFLNLTSATTTTANAWNNTSPTSSVLSLGVGTDVNGSGSTYVAYCWTPIAGFSAFGSYTGNGSTDGPMIYTGFRPKFVMVKCSSSDLSGGAHWAIEDSSRSTYNAADAILYANLSNAEGSGEPVDFLSNGFKIRNTVARWNSSGATFIYMAFAETPFKNSLGR